MRVMMFVPESKRATCGGVPVDLVGYDIDLLLGQLGLGQLPLYRENLSRPNIGQFAVPWPSPQADTVRKLTLPEN
jgi:hypothetical protein